MTTTVAPLPPLRRIAEAMLLVALLDGLAAVTFYAWILHVTTPTRIFQGIASALVGPAAFEGGLPMILLGVLMHTGVALGWSTVYAIAWSRWPALRALTRTTRGAVLAGIAYGPCVWFCMRFLILPLTHAYLQPVGSWRFLAMIGIHMVAVGTPIALLLRQAEPRPGTRAAEPSHAGA